MTDTHLNCPALRVVMMPGDTNPAGNIFGGHILSLIDMAGAVETQRICRNRFVTVCMQEVVFKKPVRVGDVLTCWARVTRIGTTSITTAVDVEAERNGRIIPVTTATVVYVAVNDRERPVALRPRKGHRKDGCCLQKKSPVPAARKQKLQQNSN